MSRTYSSGIASALAETFRFVLDGEGIPYQEVSALSFADSLGFDYIELNVFQVAHGRARRFKGRITEEALIGDGFGELLSQLRSWNHQRNQYAVEGWDANGAPCQEYAS